MPNAKATTRQGGKPKLFGVQLSAELDDQLTTAAKTLGLSKSGIARLAIQRGLLVVMEQLQPEGGES